MRFTHSYIKNVQGGSNMTGTDLCVNLATSVPVIFEPPCIWDKMFRNESCMIIKCCLQTAAYKERNKEAIGA